MDDIETANRILTGLARDQAAMTDLLVRLVRIPSLGGRHEEVAIQTVLAEWLLNEGLEVDHWRLPLTELVDHPDFPGAEVDRDEAWGVVGRLPGAGGGRTLMLNGHVDVVPADDLPDWTKCAPFHGTVAGGEVLGRGACDMKGGLVAALFAARAVAKCGIRLPGDLLVACVAGEEDGGLGTFGLLERGWRADACVITEPTGLDLVPANAGALTFRLLVSGKAVHASRRGLGVSAVERFWPVFNALRDLERRRNRSVDPVMTRWDIAYPIEIGTIRAGDWVSTVPASLVAEGRLGVALGESMADARLELERAVAEACRTDEWLRDNPVGVEWWGGQFAAGSIGDDTTICERLRQQHAAVTGVEPAMWGAPYGSDLRLLTGLGGIPTVQYGPGDVAQAHGPNESVPLAEVMTAARVLALTAVDFCSMEK